MSRVAVYVSGLDPEKVMEETWGPSPNPGTRYRVTVLFCHGEYGERTVIRAETGALNGGGPWFWQDVNDWLLDQPTEEGQVYRFTGTYRRSAPGFAFEGLTERLEVP